MSESGFEKIARLALMLAEGYELHARKFQFHRHQAEDIRTGAIVVKKSADTDEEVWPFRNDHVAALLPIPSGMKIEGPEDDEMAADGYEQVCHIYVGWLHELRGLIAIHMKELLPDLKFIVRQTASGRTNYHLSPDMDWNAFNAECRRIEGEAEHLMRTDPPVVAVKPAVEATLYEMIPPSRIRRSDHDPVKLGPVEYKMMNMLNRPLVVSLADCYSNNGTTPWHGKYKAGDSKQYFNAHQLTSRLNRKLAGIGLNLDWLSEDKLAVHATDI